MQLAETKDSRIAQYSFGKSISQLGMTVYSCTSARKGKKIFGNDPDPTKEYHIRFSDDIVTGIQEQILKGKLQDMEDYIREIGIYISSSL